MCAFVAPYHRYTHFGCYVVLTLYVIVNRHNGTNRTQTNSTMISKLKMNVLVLYITDCARDNYF